MAESSKKLLATQSQLQRSIGRSVENLKKLGRSNLTPAILRSRISLLKDNWLLFFNGHSELLKAVSETSQASISYFKDNSFDFAEDTYNAALDYMTECLEKLEPPAVSHNQSSHDVASAHSSSSFSLSHLPPISLPPFDGAYDQWEHFRDRFTALIIQNRDLRSFARMHYLVSCLKGSALECVKDLAVTAENFEIAWNALNARFENKRRLIRGHLSNLLNLPTVSRESSGDIQALIDAVNSSLFALNNLQRSPTDLWHDMLVHLVCQRLDSSSRKAWSLKSSDSDGLPSVDELLQFLRHRMRGLDDFSGHAPRKSAVSIPTRKVSASTASPKVLSAPAPAAAPVASASASGNASALSPSPCPLCQAHHFFNSCPLFIKGSPSQRREFARLHKRCFNCLSRNHVVRDCSSKYYCRLCKQRHHTMLHLSSADDSTSPSSHAPSATEADPSADSRAAVTSLLASRGDTPAHAAVLLATAWISVRGASGRSMRVRALLDQGSEMTFISETVARTLRLKRLRSPISVYAVGGVNAGTFQFAKPIVVSPVNARSPSVATTALIMKKSTSYAPRCVAGLSSFAHLRGLAWADANPASSDPIDIIIGADIYNDLILEGLRKGKPGHPIAQQSVFGWLISGPVSSISKTVTRRGGTIDRACFHSSVAPFDHNLSLNDESKSKAQIPLDRLRRRFRSKPKHDAEYRDFMSEHEGLGYIRVVSCSSAAETNCVFLPHHPVFRSNRVASRKSKRECLTSTGGMFRQRITPLTALAGCWATRISLILFGGTGHHGLSLLPKHGQSHGLQFPQVLPWRKKSRQFMQSSCENRSSSHLVSHRGRA